MRIPSAWPNRIITFLSVAGAGVSAYLTAAHLQAVRLGCTRVAGCEEVAKLWSAKGLGIPGLEMIPTAALGLMMYLTFLALAFMRAATESAERNRRLANLQWLLSVFSLGVTGWLTYMEAFVIKAWCQWCLVSAFIILTMFLIATYEQFRWVFLSQSLSGPSEPKIETQGEPV